MFYVLYSPIIVLCAIIVGLKEEKQRGEMEEGQSQL